MTYSCTRSIRRGVSAVAAAVLLALVFASTAFAQADIQSAGPLTDITIGDDLTCEVTANGSPQFFGGDIGETGTCGTSLAAGDQIYGYQGTVWTSVSPAKLSGDGTSQDPYKITTTVQAMSNSVVIGLAVTEVDSYVVGDPSYRTDITVTNTSDGTFSDLKLYHAADCLLQGSDSGFGFTDPASGSVACTETPNNNPSGGVEEFVPITGGSNYLEAGFSVAAFDVPASQADYANGCDCTTDEDNGMGINWDIASLPAGQSSPTFSMLTSFSANSSQITATGGSSLAGTAGSPVSGTVASVSDPNSGDTASDLSATIDWGDGTSSAGTITGGSGSFNVTGSHAYVSGGSYPITVTITRVGDAANTATASDSAVITPVATAVITSVPTPVVTGATTPGVTGAGFSGSVVPGGLATTALFQYGLDPKYTGGGSLVYTNSTPSQPVGSDFSSHAVSASVGALVPNAVYHVRLVATNSAGTTFGPDVSFTTDPAPPPSQPTLGQTVNIKPVSGIVLIKINGRLVPLTELRQIPQNVVIDALHGTLQVITAAGGGQGARDAAAKGGKKHKNVKTQSGTFGGAVFKLKQSHNGLATLSLVEGAVKGGPSFATCKASKHKAADATAAALSSKTLQLLHASAKGKYSTKGRYGAATVRGTKWTIADRCNGTQVHDVTDSVAVTDFVRHKTIILHAGQSYLAKARK